jgi:TIR domain
MPIFISYSHQDREFVDRLALQLVQNRINVWVDRWELNVGDSLLSRIQDAITGASALLVVLSRASVSSAWVEKEINSGLVRELEEHRVIVLPVLIEDCQIPVFLREKVYADFRSNFDAGLKRILESVARISNAETGRIEDPTYHSDWAFDWGSVEDRVWFRFTIVEQAQDQPYTVLSLVRIVADREATKAYMEMARTGRAEEAHTRVTKVVVDAVNTPNSLVFLLEDQFEQDREYTAADGAGTYYVRVSARRLGADTGRDVLYRAGQQLLNVLQHMEDVTAGPADAPSA